MNAVIFIKIKLIAKKIVFNSNRNNNATRHSHWAAEITFLNKPTKFATNWQNKALGKKESLFPKQILKSNNNKCTNNILFL